MDKEEMFDVWTSSASGINECFTDFSALRACEVQHFHTIQPNL